MKKTILIYLLLFVSLYACKDDIENGDTDTGTILFTISARDIANNSHLNGGTYRVLNENNEVVGTYTLSNGSIKIIDLPNINYIIEEISPPLGYINRDEEKKYYYYSESNSREFVFLYINTETRAIPKSVNLKFYSTENSSFLGDYNGIRIGEYYWVDRNFTSVIPWGTEYENAYPITQKLLDRYVERIRIDISEYQLENISDFEKYYGRYYSYPSILYMNRYGSMRDEYNQEIDGWKLPATEDYRQLFAMSPFNTTADGGSQTSLSERDVRFALSAKQGDSPLAFDIQDPNGGPYKTYWFEGQHITNIHRFNLMPGGARLNGPGPWCNGLGPNNGCYNDGAKGDIYHLFYAAYLAVDKLNDEQWVGVVKIHDRVDTKDEKTYHLLNVRWCRRLTDAELGYKLYINTEQTDIKKLDIDTPVPDGYKELTHGYIRGFYVQYILNNPESKVTVQDIILYAKSVQDNYVTENRNNKNVIL
ncbi:MAG: SpaA isopeptide-forming pilin-related protein [Dysgonomonas sp.]